MFYLLEAKANSHCIHGISIFGNQQIALGFADDTLIFAKSDQDNIQNVATSLKLFSPASALHINMRKSALIDISTQHFHSLNSEGPKIKKGIVFPHLGYPLGVNVSTKDRIEWVLSRIRCKMDMWHAAQWPLHARMRIVQSFLQPYVMYNLLLLDWRKCHFRIFECLLKDFLWNKTHNRALVLSAWKYVFQPKKREGID
ncbi:hypothetical protein KP509_09G071500 [Ceratopteris richardii]|uniref:Reverse transcriptase domain-containing protein n=1 Tax=Ceratopteris richardii TaxID=49495 RepID=A0A8T2U5H4_CERRI|nr:hypothetical protein KP509_09G071500 [Ceratopteris richardii]